MNKLGAGTPSCLTPKWSGPRLCPESRPRRPGLRSCAAAALLLSRRRTSSVTHRPCVCRAGIIPLKYRSATFLEHKSRKSTPRVPGRVQGLADLISPPVRLRVGPGGGQHCRLRRTAGGSWTYVSSLLRPRCGVAAAQNCRGNIVTFPGGPVCQGHEPLMLASTSLCS